MSDKSKREKNAAELEKRAKQLRREEQAFWTEVAERLDEIKARHSINIRDRYADICITYGAYTDEERDALYAHLTSDRQVEFYRRIAGGGHGGV